MQAKKKKNLIKITPNKNPHKQRLAKKEWYI